MGQDPEKQEGLERIVFNNTTTNNNDVMFSAERQSNYFHKFVNKH